MTTCCGCFARERCTRPKEIKMSVPAAYLGVVLIWSTTPLAVKWSGEGPGFLFGALGRMGLATLLCLVAVAIFRIARRTPRLFTRAGYRAT
jgi:drug/metabolite transporter (DMT)-like permease